MKSIWGDLSNGHSKTLCVFSTYSDSGLVTEDVFYYLESLKKCDADIVVVSTSPQIQGEYLNRFLQVANVVCHRENIGYDFSSYRAGIDYAWPHIDKYERLVLANDSVYGPFSSLKDLICFGDESGCDIWGATDSKELSYHLQSYFLVYSRKVLASKEFKRFWEGVLAIPSDLIEGPEDSIWGDKGNYIPAFKKKIIENYEVGGSRYFVEHGFKLAARWPVSDLISDLRSGRFVSENLTIDAEDSVNSSHFFWDWLISKKAFPFLKKEVLNVNPLNLFLKDWRCVIGEVSDYPLQLIEKHRASVYGEVGRFDWLIESKARANSLPSLPYFIENLLTSFPDLGETRGVNFDTEIGRLMAIAWWENPGRHSSKEICWPGCQGFPRQIYQPYVTAPQNFPLKITNGLVAAVKTRPDIQGVDFESHAGCSKALLWRMEHGCHEYRFLEFSDDEIAGLYEPSCQIPGASRWSEIIVFYDSVIEDGLAKRFLDKIDYYSSIFDRLSAKLKRLSSSGYPAKFQPADVLGSYCNHGVNIVGLPTKPIGVGEDARMLGKCLEAVPVSFAMLEAPIADQIPSLTLEASLAARIRDKPTYRYNVITLPAQDCYQLTIKGWGAHFQGRHNIGALQWELPLWPARWSPILSLFDEIWAQSRFVEDMFRRATSKPVFYMPLSVGEPEFEPIPREIFGIDPHGFVVMSVFDANSWYQRKNPFAVIDAFQLAFPGKKDVQLVLKLSNGIGGSVNFNRLSEMVSKDSRIIVINKSLKKEEFYALLNCADVFVSLHRSEGFGRIIAEAMYLGKPVISTNYSGSVDFANHRTAFVVDGPLVSLGQSDYVDYVGQVWMDPDVGHAAEQMIKVYEAGEQVTRIALEGKKYVTENHGVDVVSRRVVKRLIDLGVVNVRI